MIASSICTARTGYAPAAVSPDSMMASALCDTAVAASLTSARVAATPCRIDSSTCVASTVGTPRARAAPDHFTLHSWHALEWEL